MLDRIFIASCFLDWTRAIKPLTFSRFFSNALELRDRRENFMMFENSSFQPAARKRRS